MENAKPAGSKVKAAKSGRSVRSRGTGQLVLQKGASISKKGAVSIAVPTDIFNVLSRRRPSIKKLMEAFGKTIERSQKSGVAGGFTVTINAAGDPKIAPLPSPGQSESPVSEDDRLDAALRAARERGRVRAADVLDGDDMLTAEQFAERLGVSRVTVNTRRQKHELLGLDGAKRGFRFPSWQVDDDGKALEALPKLFSLLGDSPWGVYRFLNQRHSVLNGVTARDALARGRTTQVLQAAESVARGDFA